LQVAISVEQGRLILPEGSGWDTLSSHIPDPSRSVALLAVIVIHAVALGGLLTLEVSPRLQIADAVIEAAILPTAPKPDATDPSLPRMVDWQPVLPDVPLPQVALEQPSTAITFPPPAALSQTAAPPVRSADADGPPILDAQSVGYLVPPAPRYPPASRRAREEGEVLVRVLIDVDGRPNEIRILRSSGHERLDEAAIEAVRAALFRPYVADGRARAAYVRVPVEFALRRS
jgi:periplasmic protein TonB